MQLKAIEQPTLEEMNRMTAEGWKLDCFTPGLAIFKKED